ncbi:hypothetical protein BDA96_07G101700 [Sorghum bicolor]|uniref:Uncharacterized protein n=2 Tax=Sorghum bicolor TaxID=4558 RepID=A0A921U9A3_SORBI|nr:hypothetical protein BDA96_07G101700 [Sorghum bicolor]OQU80215.1 hypothetical protein SORBI_3007G095333 [Sorghum bicolor]
MQFEFRLTAVDGFEPGQPIDFTNLFKEDDLINVSNNSIGKGFQLSRERQPASIENDASAKGNVLLSLMTLLMCLHYE